MMEDLIVPALVGLAVLLVPSGLIRMYWSGYRAGRDRADALWKKEMDKDNDIGVQMSLRRERNKARAERDELQRQLDELGVRNGD